MTLTKDILDSEFEKKIHLVLEQAIKSFAEPVVIQFLKEVNDSLENHPNLEARNWHLISRGGDALNYYYREKKFIPTHDWDLGFVRIPNNDNMDQDTFNSLKIIQNTVGTELAKRLNNFFANYVKYKYRKELVTAFTYKKTIHRLEGITYTYTYKPHGSTSDVYGSNSICDIYINGNFKSDVVYNPGDQNPVLVDSMQHYDDKLEFYKLQQLITTLNLQNEDQLLQYLQQVYANDRILFKNTFSYIIRDKKSHMKYVSPGDLLTDTMRMIYQSYNNIGITPGNNKLIKYIIKYSNLLDVINNMISLCPNNTCDEITAYMLSRDTDKYSCDSKLIVNRQGWEQNIAIRLSKFYEQAFFNDPMINLLTSKKICEMLEILENVERHFNV